MYSVMFLELSWEIGLCGAWWWAPSWLLVCNFHEDPPMHHVDHQFIQSFLESSVRLDSSILQQRTDHLSFVFSCLGFLISLPSLGWPRSALVEALDKLVVLGVYCCGLVSALIPCQLIMWCLSKASAGRRKHLYIMINSHGWYTVICQKVWY